MSPRNQKNNRPLKDTTTDFFLKIIEKEKDQTNKDTSSKESVNEKKVKAIDTGARFYNYMNQLLDKILSSKVSITILSFVMAAVLFYSVSGKDILTSPTSGATLENVPVYVENLNDSLEASGIPESVSVVLVGPSLDIYKTNFSKDYQVYLDLQDLDEGDYVLNLRTRNFPESLQVVSIPSSIKVTLAKKVTRTFDLGYRFINEDQLDSKYSVSVNQMDLDTVELRASEETLSRVETVEACIDVSDKTEDFEQNARIRAYDSNGEELNVEMSPESVHVTCQVSSYSKTVPIHVNLVGNLPTGYQVSQYTLSQSEVTIFGLEEQLNEIQQVEVDVDITDLKSSTTMTNLALKKIAGINKFSQDAIDVSVEIEKVITKKFDNIPIKVLNNSRDYKVSFAGQGQNASVSVTGTEDKINTLKVDNIQATIDIDGLDVGTHQVNVKIAGDDETLTMKLLSSSKVTINIERN